MEALPAGSAHYRPAGRRPLLVALGTVVTLLLCAPVANAMGVQPQIKLGDGLYAESAADVGDRTLPAPSTGDRPDDRVIGGAAASIEQHPWQAALAYSPAVVPGDGRERQFCGGTLVADNVVVTAAHCVIRVRDDGTVGVIPPEDFNVIAGRTHLCPSCAGVPTSGTEVGVADWYTFTDANGNLAYDPQTNAYDVVWLILGPHDPFTVARPILVAGPGEEPTWTAGRQATVSGWGTVNPDGDTQKPADYPNDLRAAGVQIADDASCAANYGAAGIGIDSQTMLCAGVAAGGIDSCFGDSGGPLTVPVEIGAATTVRLVGDTSFGPSDCALAGFPGVYGRLAADPIRGALQAGVAGTTNPPVNILGSGARPVEVPDTKITKRKAKPGRKVRLKIGFTATEPANFECRLKRKGGGGSFKPCTSPYKRKVRGLGKYTFQARAIDQLGQGDPKPAQWRFRIVRARPVADAPLALRATR